MQTILGSGGAIAVELAKVLPFYTKKIRLSSRNPKKVNHNDELVTANLLNLEQVKSAVKGSEVVYLMVGITYNKKIWKKEWPLIMFNVIAACKEFSSRLVFFDNVYMYDTKNIQYMDENAVINPVSEKGKVRKLIADMVLSAVEHKEIKALIARSADFYGPGIKRNCMLTETVFGPLSKGKKASWLDSVNYKHSFTYSLDAAKAIAVLGNSNKSYGQVWHLPTAKDPLTGKEWIELIAQELNTNAKYMIMSKFTTKCLSFFVPILKEVYEMIYQFDRDYVFDSSKFETQFEFTPTSYVDAVKFIVKSDYS